MHVALTADPMLPVPPNLYGGIERVIDLPPDGPPSFLRLRRLIGWRLARRVQRSAERRAFL